jgi:hypothetical protein
VTPPADGVEGDLDDRIIETIFSLDGGFTGAQRLLDEGITGIVAASDMMALGAIRAARHRGLDVPADVSVVGFDDTELMRFTDPPLTTLHQPVSRIERIPRDPRPRPRDRRQGVPRAGRARRAAASPPRCGWSPGSRTSPAAAAHR